MKTIGTLFTGFGLADVGAMAAGFTPLWGVEYDSDIAAVANANLGNHVRVANILDCDPHDFQCVDLLHASPPCPNFSAAKVNRAETENDIAVADKVAEFIRIVKPRAVTIENVRDYARAESYRRILTALSDLGFMYDAQVLNAADFGVPQTRLRLIVRAVHGAFVPSLPAPVKWVGWYEAIADLVDTLPETTFAEWQMKRLPEEITRSFLTDGMNTSRPATVRTDEKPAMTIQAARGWRPSQMAHAFITDSSSASRPPTVRTDTQPAMTVVASQGRAPMRAYLLNRHVSEREDLAREAEEPAYVVTTNDEGRRRAWLANGRVVRMTPRAHARFQSLPDWYELPTRNSLAMKGIGNGLPCKMYQAIAGGFDL
jgi:DNA (cytosine-5)-methyltransferase 1